MSKPSTLFFGSLILILGLGCGGKVEQVGGGQGGAAGQSGHGGNGGSGGKGGTSGQGGISGQGGSAAASGVGGSGGTTVDLCESGCAKCGAGQSDCVTECQKGEQGACANLYKALLACVIDHQCSQTPCQSQIDAYAVCYSGGNGGSGGGTGGWGGAGGSGAYGGYAGYAGSGGGSCEASDPTNTCDVCAAAKCCAEFIACADDPGGPYGKCMDVLSCAMACDAGTFQDCLNICNTDYNPQVNDYYTCVWVDQCASQCQ